MMTLYIALTYMIEKFLVYEKYLGKLHQPLLSSSKPHSSFPFHPHIYINDTIL